MRKLLYSPGFGAGWTTWHHGSKEEMMFMLTYQPFIDILENKKEIKEKDEEKFEEDWKEKFPESYPPYTGGVCNLTIYYCEDDVLIKIREYDGSESVEEKEIGEWY